MISLIKRVDRFQGTLTLPPSKSYSIRAFLTAARGGTSKIINPSNSDDVKAARLAASGLGAKIKPLRKNIWKVVVPSGAGRSRSTINVKESGTVLRFLLPILSLQSYPVKIIGEGTLKNRPNRFLLQALRQRGVKIKGRGPKDCVPIKISGGTFKAGPITINGSLSSQFISALLMACPSLTGNSKVTITGREMVSKTYITMTRQVLKKSGVHVRKKGGRIFFIKGNQKFRGLKNFIVPSDYGLAAFFMAAAALVKSNITLKGNLKDDLLQADRAILPFLKRMGVKFTKTNSAIKMKGPYVLRGGRFSLLDCPDLVPVMAVLALFAKGTTRLCDIQHVRTKESDRISDLRKELLKVGARVKEKANELIIEPAGHYRSNCLLDPHHDHRLAMAFSVLSLKVGARIKDITCTRKSYPSFVTDFKKLCL